MENFGQLTKDGGRYVFTYPPLQLVIRGAHPEWVLEAAAEVIAETEKRSSDGAIDELETLIEFEEATDIELDMAKFDNTARFEVVPQCLVSMGDGDFRWVSAVGRNEQAQSVTRIHDMSLTRNDTFLVDEEQN